MPARSAASAARDYLAAHYARPVFLAEASRQACLSPFYFNRLFTQSSNETPHEFVTRRRIERAKMPLLAGNHSVTEICFEVGYESLGSFSTRFSSLTGLSPAAFRGEALRIFGGFGVRWPLYYIRFLSRICGVILVPGVVPSCDRGQFP